MSNASGTIEYSARMTRRIESTVLKELVALLRYYRNTRIPSDTVQKFVDDFLPRGSGIDCGCKIDLQKSNGAKIVLETSFHHMNEVGYYDGWTEHKIVITPDFEFGFDLSVTGRNRNDVKGYLVDTFHCALMAKIDHQVLEFDYKYSDNSIDNDFAI
jgi:hypothetical protein